MVNLNIIKRRKFWLIFASTLTTVSLVVFFVWGLRLGIDFTGGSLMEISFKDMARPTSEAIVNAVKEVNLSGLEARLVGESEVTLKFKETDETVHQNVLTKLRETFLVNGGIKEDSISKVVNGGVSGSAAGLAITGVTAETKDAAVAKPQGEIIENRFESIGPTVGAELKRKAMWAVTLVVICIVLYIAWAFRHVSEPVASWKYGVAAILALLHDIMIVVGLFVLLGKFAGVEIDTAFIAALLTVLGYSVNDTIIIFDRVRENLHKYEGKFELIVNKSINETMMRSINTTFTTLVALFAVYFFGGATIKYFALALLVGIFSGAYSSIFIASPILVVWEAWDRRRRMKRAGQS